MVDETFVAKHFAGENPLGKRLKFGGLTTKRTSGWRWWGRGGQELRRRSDSRVEM
jgi:hypothetical protein